MPTADSGCFIDTNLLVYSSGVNLPLCRKSRQFLNGLLDKFDYLAISSQVIREFLVVVTHPATSENPFSATEAVECLQKLLPALLLLPEENQPETLFELIGKYNIVGKRIHDANIVATMLSNQIRYIATANEKDFKCFAEIEVVPFV